MDKTLSGANIPALIGRWSDGNEGVHCTPQSSNITGTSQSYCFVSYQGHSSGLTLLQRSNRCILQPQTRQSLISYLALFVFISKKCFGYDTKQNPVAGLYFWGSKKFGLPLHRPLTKSPLRSRTLLSLRFVWFGLVWFYGISTIVGYLMPNPVIYIYIYIYICVFDL